MFFGWNTLPEEWNILNVAMKFVEWFYFAT